MAGNFFSVSIGAIDEIAKQTSQADAVLAYLVLAKHKQSKTAYASAGEFAISNYLGIPRGRAGKILNRLKKVSWGDAPHQRAVIDAELWARVSESEAPSSVYTLLALPPYGEKSVYLPNQFIVGTGKGTTPIAKLKTLLPMTDRLDTLRLLVHLYDHHHLGGFGGVDPGLICREWESEGLLEPFGDLECPLGYLGSREGGVEFDRLHFWCVRPSKDYSTSAELKALTEGDDDRLARAVRQLFKARLVYEVAVVFSHNPKESESAEVLYPLYVFDRLIRECEEEQLSGAGGIAKLVMDCLERSGLLEEQGLSHLPSAVIHAIQQRRAIHSGVYFYAADTHSAAVVSVLRLHYRPHTKDTGVGWDLECQRASLWEQEFKQSFRKRHAVPTG